MTKKLTDLLKKYPLWLQFASLFTVMITLVISILITNDYIHNKDIAIQTHINHTTRVLQLEMDTITQYIRDLTGFSIQPCYDSRFIRIIESKSTINDDDIDYVKDQMKGYYYTRSDINSYNIYLMNNSYIVGRNSGDQHITARHLTDISAIDSLAFDECAHSRYYLSIIPSNSDKDFFTFYHSIIQIDNKSSLAFVRCDVSKLFISSLIKTHAPTDGEILLLFNNNGDLLFSSSSDYNPLFNAQVIDNMQNGSTIISLDNKKYLFTYNNSDAYGLSYISLQPYSIISNQEKDLIKSTIIHAIMIWLIFTLLINVLCRILMKPLNELATRLKNVGEGDFEYRANISGSLEVANLGDSYNYMSEHIQTLIHENYISKLSEQSAKLIALEAQINPHFLYNTLQAISTEALINDQPQIHEMVISLASLLRYSIKGEDLVNLEAEINYVRQYIYLNKIRMDDNLSTTINIDAEAYSCIIPKISIQTLVENAIVHGVNGEITSICINITAYLKNEHLVIEVQDNGAGMDDDTYNRLIDSFNEESILSQTTGVGLANLYGRLKILYNNEGTLTIETVPNIGTTIKIILPIMR